LSKKRKALIKKALAETFPEINKVVASTQWFDTKFSGATLTACLIADDGLLYTANVGDSMALLLTYDQKLKDQ
jgi:serine/threonine protein phosphatase PrpC